MNDKVDASVLLIGGPDSGKSNFLFRLWLHIASGKGLLVQNGLPAQLEYLKVGSKELLSGDFAQRTQHDVYTESAIPVRTNGITPEGNGALIVPDCWGERWVSIYRKREWSERWENHISERTGCLVFLRAGSSALINPLDWVQCEQRWGVIVGEGEVAVEPPIPTQVLMVEWLQFLAEAFRAKGGSGQPRVGIVVAAWDQVPEDRKADGPLAYIGAEFPLLHQFLVNTDEFEVEVFGTTIAGGDLQNEPGFKAKCLEKGDPLSGGYIVYGSGSVAVKSVDFTLPVAWAMGLTELIKG